METQIYLIADNAAAQASHSDITTKHAAVAKAKTTDCVKTLSKT